MFYLSKRDYATTHLVYLYIEGKIQVLPSSFSLLSQAFLLALSFYILPSLISSEQLMEKDQLLQQ